MRRTTYAGGRSWLGILAVCVLVVATAAAGVPASADTLAPPWDGNPVSPGLGPTYGEEWCAPASVEPGIAGVQGPPLAIIPYGAIRCTLDLFQVEAEEAGIPPRMTYSVIGQSAGGRDIYGVVVNALETPEQVRDYQRWQEIRSIMLSDPAGAQALLESYGDEVKIPIFIEANIHGGERESTDAMMQVIRDLVTTPYGVNETVDAVLDHAIVVVIPTTNPDGRVAGTRANANGFDMNRDLLVQSQPEMRANIAFQLQWLAPVGLAMHGYYNPTLIDGLTKPHNPGIEYDKFLYWNQRRLDANEEALAAIGRTIQRPVNDWGANANTQPPTGPYYAEGWDDWGPFYTQTYMALHGVDSSTVEMCNNTACGGRFGSKREQYLTFYSSAEFWIENRESILHDQLEIFRRARAGEPRPNCCEDPLLQERGFTEDQHNWMVEYPKAFVIPFDDGAGGKIGIDAQRSDAEANRLVEWLLFNGIEVHRLNKAYTWDGRTFPKKSYVVWMNQPRRGIALTALNVGQDITQRIGRLYASPAAWSHGYLWGADVVEVPREDTAFNPITVPITAPNALKGGVRGGGPSAWYSLRLRGVSEVRAVLQLLRDGIDAEMAEEPFTSTSGGPMPAGTLIFPNDPVTVAALDAVGKSVGVWFERNWKVQKPPTTQVDEAPKVAVLGTAPTMPAADYTWVLKQIFGPDVGWISAAALGAAGPDPLESYDVLYNAGVSWTVLNDTAKARVTAFLDHGGGYIATSQASAGFGFLPSAGLVTGTFAQATSGTAYGGIAKWENTGVDGPLTGGYAAFDYLYLPSATTFFSAVPDEAVMDGRYLPTMSQTPSDGYLAGLWANRGTETNNAPVIVHGETSLESRYAAMATNPFSRGDAEREWLWVGQAALWSNLTDEAA
jgi:hypothetical protein